MNKLDYFFLFRSYPLPSLTFSSSPSWFPLSFSSFLASRHCRSSPCAIRFSVQLYLILHLFHTHFCRGSHRRLNELHHYYLQLHHLYELHFVYVAPGVGINVIMVTVNRGWFFRFMGITVHLLNIFTIIIAAAVIYVIFITFFVIMYNGMRQ